MNRLEFFFDFGSPYSYLAHSQLDGLGADVVFRPMRVLKVMELVGNQPTTLQSQAKFRYAHKDLERWANYYGVPVNPPKGERRNDGEILGRAALAAVRTGEQKQVVAALFHAYWGTATPLTTEEQILSVLDATGFDVATLAKLIGDPVIAAELDANNAEAAERGVFGAPTIFVGDDMFFGNDRFHFIKERLAA